MKVATKVQPIQSKNDSKVTVDQIKTEFQNLLFKDKLVISDIEERNLNLNIPNLIRVLAYGIRMTPDQEFIISKDTRGNVSVFKMDALERVFHSEGFIVFRYTTNHYSV